jgi:hypothetical protein
MMNQETKLSNNKMNRRDDKGIRKSFIANSKFYAIEADFYDEQTELYLGEGGRAKIE